MGIPGLYGYLRRQFPSCVRSATKLDGRMAGGATLRGTVGDVRADVLLVDFNAVIHDVIGGMGVDAAAFDDAYMDTVVSNSVAAAWVIADTYIRKTSCDTRPVMYIALDGSPPYAKMHQQRLRRYMSASSDGDGCVGRHAVTPGTKLMSRMSAALAKMSAERGGDDVRVVVSDSTEDGEGEQKIFQYLDRIFGNASAEGVSIVIHGVDADIILMSLMSPHWRRITILRRAYDGGGGCSGSMARSAPQEPEYELLSVSELHHGIARRISSAFRKSRVEALGGCLEESAPENDALVRDFCILCLLLGNDFIPGLHGITIKNNGIDILINAYSESFAEHAEVIAPNPNATTTAFTALSDGRSPFVQFARRPSVLSRGGPEVLGGLNTERLRCLLKCISAREDSLVSTTDFRSRETYMRTLLSRQSQSGPVSFDIDVCALDYIRAYSLTGCDGWRVRYYKQLFDKYFTRDDVNAASLSYIFGIGYAYRYLGSNVCLSKGWHYPYTYAPTMLDVYTRLCDDVLPEVRALIETRDAQLDRFEVACTSFASRNRSAAPAGVMKQQLRLLLILPMRSLQRLMDLEQPRRIIEAAESRGVLWYMYPSSFRVQRYGKERVSDCAPLIPSMDLSVLSDLIMKAAE